MAERKKIIRLSKAAREFNVSISTIVDFLNKKGITIDSNPNTKLTPEIYAMLVTEYQTEKYVKEESHKIDLDYSDHKTITLEDKLDALNKIEEEQEDIFINDIFHNFNDDIEIKEKVTAVEKVEEEKTEKAKVEKAKIKPEEKEIIPEEKEKISEKKKTEKIIPEKKSPETKEKEIVTKKVEKKVEEKKLDVETEEKITQKEDVKQKPAEVEDTFKKEIKEETKKITLEKKEGAKQLKIVDKINIDDFKKTKKSAKKKFEKSIKQKQGKKEAPIKKQKEKISAATNVQEKPLKKSTQKLKKEIETSLPKEEKQEQKVVIPPKEKEEDNFIKTEVEKIKGPKILGSILLPEKEKPVASSSDNKLKANKRKRKRIKKTPKPAKPVLGEKNNEKQKNKSKFVKKGQRPKKIFEKHELSEEEVQKQIKATLARLSSTGKSKASKHRRDKRHNIIDKAKQKQKIVEKEKKTLKVTEFVTVSELATMMSVGVNEIISTCLSLGLFVSINQRLDAETINLLAEEYGFKTEFVSVDVQESIKLSDEEDKEEDLLPRPPIVTVMGHVDHGKTSLLDYIRKTNIIAGESGGITQHIGAYEVLLETGEKVTFLDTPGHEAFTAMRARGAQATDIAIIIIAADDKIMPQTVEAINHAQAAGVPIIIAINKIDKPNAKPDVIKEGLANMNILVEDWGGDYQCQEISAKKGIGIKELLEKVIIEAEMLELKANPNKHAKGIVIESSLDKGKGYVAKLLVKTGTLKIGDIVLAGSCYGKVKAMYNERNKKIKTAGPSTPLLLLGLDSAPQAGDTFYVMKDEHEAKAISNKRLQLQREQGLRTQKHITLDEIGRRIAIGDFKELNIIVKGDVNGSVEALSDSLLKLSLEEVQVRIIHKSIGQITESDVLLASASDAIIIGFQVRPSIGARKLAEKEQIDIRLYSVIYKAIEEIEAAIIGMLSPEIEEKIIANIEVRNIFKISKVGTIAGCMVLDGKINRNSNIRLIRDGIVVYTGKLGSLKRYKDDVKEVAAGYECGLNIENFNDIKVGDIIEAFEQVEVKSKPIKK